MPIVTPFWFKQRQCRHESHGDDRTLRVTGPNLGEAYLRVEPRDGTWLAALRLAADGPDVATAVAEEPTESAAWEAAFELYRTQLIV